MNITDLKPGVRIEYKNDPYEVITSSFSRSSQSQGFMSTKLRNLITGSVLDVTFREKDKVEPIDIEKKEAQFLYGESNKFFFMDNNTFEQFELGESVIGRKRNFLKENMDVELILYKDKPINIDIPNKVVLKVIDTEPVIKGATASDVKKPAVLETGYKLQVPVFINKGDNIRVNTERGDYIERA